MPPDVLEERKECNWDIPRRPEAIHLYGVDCMSTAECLAHFSDWGPTFVEWLDDSSCNVLFGDDFSAKRALVGRGKPLPPDASGPDTAGALLPVLGESCARQHVTGHHGQQGMPKRAWPFFQDLAHCSAQAWTPRTSTARPSCGTRATTSSRRARPSRSCTGWRPPRM